MQDSLVHPVWLCICYQGRFNGIKNTVQKGIQFREQKQELSKPLFVKRYYSMTYKWRKMASMGYFHQITTENWGITDFQYPHCK
jgi:hypothetical protein